MPTPVASNSRENPFAGGAVSWRAITGEPHTIAALAELPGLYGFRLVDWPEPGSVVIAGFTEILAGSPAALEYRVDYIGRTALVLCNVADVTTVVSVDYNGGGSVTSIENFGIGGGSGAAAENYISNPGFESATAGWVASGANFLVSRTVTAGEFLKGVASGKLTANGSQAIGDRVSYAFTIGEGDKNRRFGLRFYYKGITTYDSGDLEVVLNDGTSDIVPSVSAIPAGQGYFEAFFSTTNSTAYQLRFRSTVATAFEIALDDIVVAPAQSDVATGFASGHIGSYSPAVNTGSYGTLERNIARIWRRGKFAEIHWEFNQTAAGTAGSGAYLFSMPAGLLIDTAYTAENISFLGDIGHGYVDSATGPSSAPVVARAYDANSFYLTGVDAAAADLSSVSYNFANTTLRISMHLMVPIVGWDETTVLQNSRVVYASNSGAADANDTTNFAYGASGSVIPALTGTYKRRVDIGHIGPTDEIQIQVDWDGTGQWQFWPFFHDDANGGYGPTWERFSDTQIDVYMRGDTFARKRVSDAADRTYVQENAAGSRWRVRKGSNALAVETPPSVEEVTASLVTAGDGGTATAGSENDCSLNTLDNPNGYGWVSGPSGNAITLQPGTYSFVARQMFYNTGSTMLFLKNTTDSVYIAKGTGLMVIAANAGGDIVITGQARFSVATTIKLRYEVQSTQATNGLGPDAGMANDNVFAHLKIQRLGP